MILFLKDKLEQSLLLIFMYMLNINPFFNFKESLFGGLTMKIMTKIN